MQHAPPQPTPETAPVDDPLARERLAYDRDLPRLIGEGYEGQVALFKDDDLLGVFADEAMAFLMGAHTFVPQPFLVAPIVWREQLTRPPDWVVARARASNRPLPRISHPLLRSGLPTIHYTKLADLAPDHVLFREWRAYRRELPRLLREGHERAFGLFKADDLVGLFATHDEAMKVGFEKFLLEPFMVTPILEYEPLLRLPRSCERPGARSDSCPT